MSNIIVIETPDGTYEIKKPKGKLGARHMRYALKFASLYSELHQSGVNPFTNDQILDLFEEWCENILPHIVNKSPYTYEEIPYSHQFMIFMKVMEDIDTEFPEEFFR